MQVPMATYRDEGSIEAYRRDKVPGLLIFRRWEALDPKQHCGEDPMICENENA